jgi:hypothetical protein
MPPTIVVPRNNKYPFFLKWLKAELRTRGTLNYRAIYNEMPAECGNGDQRARVWLRRAEAAGHIESAKGEKANSKITYRLPGSAPASPKDPNCSIFAEWLPGYMAEKQKATFAEIYRDMPVEIEVSEFQTRRYLAHAVKAGLLRSRRESEKSIKLIYEAAKPFKEGCNA